MVSEVIRIQKGDMDTPGSDAQIEGDILTGIGKLKSGWSC